MKATLKHIPNKQEVDVTFSATVQIAGSGDPHTLRVTVQSDAGVPVTKTVTVTAGPRLQAPAVLIDLAPVTAFDPSSPMVQTLLGNIAKELSNTPLLRDLANTNKMVVGPSAMQLTEPRPLLRLGLWILDANFPANELIKATKDFPMPQLTAAVAQESFGLAPLLNAPPPSEVPPASLPLMGFALSVPVTTLQTLLDAMMPDLVAQAASSDVTLETGRIQVDSAGSVTTTFTGQLPASIGITANLTEKLGTAQRAGTQQSMPLVVSSSHSVSVGDELDWFIGTFVPIVGLVLVTALGLTSEGVGDRRHREWNCRTVFREPAAAGAVQEQHAPDSADQSAAGISVSDGGPKLCLVHDGWHGHRGDRLGEPGRT